ncbi:MAG: PEP/pyruvate-binding domain-containing protein [Planctomycetota bacterium]|jgi:hypothetical protein
MQRILKTLEKKYQYPVDIEFTVNFTEDEQPLINLLQCRPLQTKGLPAEVEMPSDIEPDKILFQCQGHFMGGSVYQHIKRIIYVQPEEYITLPISQKYDIARLVGVLNRQVQTREQLPTLLLGPGRWGTTTPSLGVPVSFSEINNIAVLGEIAYEGGNLMPELSFGTHFFQDLVESDIFYVAIFPRHHNCLFNNTWFENMPNLIADVLPDKAGYRQIVKVLDLDEGQLQLVAEVVSQKAVCFLT